MRRPNPAIQFLSSSESSNTLNDLQDPPLTQEKEEQKVRPSTLGVKGRGLGKGIRVRDVVLEGHDDNEIYFRSPKLNNRISNSFQDSNSPPQLFEEEKERGGKGFEDDKIHHYSFNQSPNPECQGYDPDYGFEKDIVQGKEEIIVDRLLNTIEINNKAKKKLEKAIILFNQKPMKGIDFLCKEDMVNLYYFLF
jgi:hypothetical protein